MKKKFKKPLHPCRKFLKYLQKQFKDVLGGMSLGISHVITLC